MKLIYQTTTNLDNDQLFLIIKERIEAKSGKLLANICWSEIDGRVTAKLAFRSENVELEVDKP